MVSGQTFEAPVQQGVPFAPKEYCRLPNRRMQLISGSVSSGVASEVSTCLTLRSMADAVAARLGTSDGNER